VLGHASLPLVLDWGGAASRSPFRQSYRLSVQSANVPGVQPKFSAWADVSRARTLGRGVATRFDLQHPGCDKLMVEVDVADLLAPGSGGSTGRAVRMYLVEATMQLALVDTGFSSSADAIVRRAETPSDCWPTHFHPPHAQHLDHAGRGRLSTLTGPVSLPARRLL